MDDTPVVVMVAVPTREVGDAIARALIEKRLAACVKAMPVTSTYRWEGAIETQDETLLLIKTRGGAFAALEAAVAALHPYAVPEIVSVPAQAVHAPYRDWLLAETQGA